MKKIFFLALILLTIFSGNAQLTQIKNMTDNKLLPIGYEKGRMKVWQNKVFYQGKGISVQSPYNFKGCNLIVSDGTEAGTKLLKDIARENYRDSYIVQWAATDNYLYFTQKVVEGYYELWRTDGTTEGTIKVDSCLAGSTQLKSYISLGPNRDFYTQAGSESLNFPDNFEDHPLSIGNKFFYTKYDPTDKVYYMYETTGTPESVTRIIGDYSYKYDYAMSYIVYNNKLYFRGAWYTVNQYSGVKYTDAKFFVYDGTNVSPTTVYADKFNGVFNGKLYYQRGAEMFSTTNLGVNKVSESTLTCMNSTFPGPAAKQNHFLMTDNFVILSGNYPCESDRYYLLNKNGERTLLALPPNNAVIEIVKDNKNAYFYSYEYTSRLVNTTEIRTRTGNYTITKVNPDLSLSSVLSYRGTLHGTASNDVLYYADVAVKQPSSTPDGSNIELWRSNGSSTYMAKDINTAVGYGYNWETQTSFDTNVGSSPLSFFTLNQVVYFIATANDGKQYLYSLNPDFTFTNATANNQWTDSENWAAQIIPFEGDSVTIPTGQTPLINGNVSVNDLTVSSPLNLAGGSLKVAGNLNLNSTITLNNNNLILSGSSSQITQASTSNYVVTNGTGAVSVENVDAARGTVTLPIGTSSNYSPVSISNSGTSDTFSARVSEGNTSPFSAVNTTWDISEGTAGGSNAGITLGWNAAQEPSGFDRANAKVGHYTGAVWDTENSSDVIGTNPYSITATGVTSFSPFAVLVPSVNTKTAGISTHSFSVYPNPVTDVLNITADEISQLQLFNASGKAVYTTLLPKGINSLSVKELQNGIYFYQLKNTDGNSSLSGKIFKK